MTEWLNSLRLRLSALLRRQSEQDLQDEVAFHLAMREDQLRTSGAINAGADAHRRFGNVTKVREDLREAWAFAPRMSTLVQDLRYAARTLRRSRGFAFVVVLTLGLGIGANTAFFSIINAALIRPLGYTDEDRLVSVQEGFSATWHRQVPLLRLGFRRFPKISAVVRESCSISECPIRSLGWR